LPDTAIVLTSGLDGHNDFVYRWDVVDQHGHRVMDGLMSWSWPATVA
jgi:hypothetical protein